MPIRIRTVTADPVQVADVSGFVLGGIRGDRGTCTLRTPMLLLTPIPYVLFDDEGCEVFVEVSRAHPDFGYELEETGTAGGTLAKLRG